VTPVLILAYAPSILLNVYNNLGGFGVSFPVSWISLYAVQFAILLFSYAGEARRAFPTSSCISQMGGCFCARWR
jgi:hypothetical protein